MREKHIVAERLGSQTQRLWHVCTCEFIEANWGLQSQFMSASEISSELVFGGVKELKRDRQLTAGQQWVFSGFSTSPRLEKRSPDNSNNMTSSQVAHKTMKVLKM